MRRSRIDPVWAAALARGKRHLNRAVRQSGGAWTAREAMRALHITRGTLRRWVREGWLLSVTYADGRVVYPRAQCRLDLATSPWCTPYMAMLAITEIVRGRLTAAELFCILATRQPMLPAADGEPRTVFEALAEGDEAQVLKMMRWLMTPPDADAPLRISTPLP